MREFDYEKLAERTWDKEVLNYIGLIHEYKGRQQLHLKQKPEELEKLVELAKIQSTEASNEIEGIRTSNYRLKQLMDDKEIYTSNQNNDISLPITKNDNQERKFNSQVIYPIISQGDVIGSVILLSKEQNKKMNETEVKVAQSAAGFLSSQMEI